MRWYIQSILPTSQLGATSDFTASRNLRDEFMTVLVWLCVFSHSWILCVLRTCYILGTGDKKVPKCSCFTGKNRCLISSFPQLPWRLLSRDYRRRKGSRVVGAEREETWENVATQEWARVENLGLEKWPCSLPWAEWSQACLLFSSVVKCQVSFKTLLPSRAGRCRQMRARTKATDVMKGYFPQAFEKSPHCFCPYWCAFAWSRKTQEQHLFYCIECVLTTF